MVTLSPARRRRRAAGCAVSGVAAARPGAARGAGRAAQVRLAVPEQQVVRRLAHHRDQFGAVRHVNRLAAAVCLGVARAVPVEVVAARPPPAPVVLGDGDLGVRRVVGSFDVSERRRIGSCQHTSGLVSTGCRSWLRARRAGRTRSHREPRSVVEDARALVHRRLALAVLVELDPVRAFLPCADVVELPVVGAEQLDQRGDALLVGLVGEVRAERAAAVVRPIGVDALAAGAEDAAPPRAQPGEVAPVGCLASAGSSNSIQARGKSSSLRAPSQPSRGPTAKPDSLHESENAPFSTSARTRVTCSSSMPTAGPRRCRHRRSRSRCGWPSTSREGALSEGGIDALVSFVGRALVEAEDKGASRSRVRHLGDPRGKQLPTRSSRSSQKRTGVEFECCPARMRRG